MYVYIRGHINRKFSIIDEIFFNSDRKIWRPSVTLTDYTEGDLL